LDWMALAKSGCGKFHPTKAPSNNQKIVSNMLKSFFV
jgi:hypothetical protein